MRHLRSLLAGTTASALVLLAGTAGAAPVAAAGSATSTASVVAITAAGHSVALTTFSATASTLAAALAKVEFVPVTVDGTKVGAVSVDPSTAPKTVGGVTTAAVAALPASVLSATSPSATLTAAIKDSLPSAGLTGGLGTIKVLNMPLGLSGALSVGSAVSNVEAKANKVLTITDVSLPSINDLLAALGLDISKLPVDVLNGLVDQIGITVTTAVETAQQAANDAIDTAQSAVDSAAAAADGADAALTAATSALETALGNLIVPLTLAEWNAMDTAAQDALRLLNPALDTAVGAYATAAAAVDAAQAALNAAIDTLQAKIADLADLVKDVLAGVPLVSLDAANVGIVASVGTTKLAKVTGTVSGLKVLGTDVLKDVLGSSTVDVVEMVTAITNQINGAISTVTGALSGVLAGVTDATGIQVPAPSVKVLQKVELTGQEGAFGTAYAGVTALAVSLGEVRIPRIYALPEALAGTLAGVTQTATGVLAKPLSITVGQLGEGARFRPASSNAAPGTPGSPGNLPTTGGPAALAVIALGAIGFALLAKRHLGKAAA